MLAPSLTLTEHATSPIADVLMTHSEVFDVPFVFIVSYGFDCLVWSAERFYDIGSPFGSRYCGSDSRVRDARHNTRLFFQKF